MKENTPVGIPQLLDSRKDKLICCDYRQIGVCVGWAEKRIATTASHMFRN